VVLPNNLVIKQNMTSVEGAQMNGAQMNGSQMDGAKVNGTQMVGAQMDGAKINGTQIDGAQRESSKSFKKGHYNDGFDFWETLYSAITGLISGPLSCGFIAFMIKLYKFLDKKCFKKVQNDLISDI
jgi:hypothetical protein